MPSQYPPCTGLGSPSLPIPGFANKGARKWQSSTVPRTKMAP